VAFIVDADDALQPVGDPVPIQLVAHGEGDLVEVAPVLVAVEDRLEDDQFLGREDVDRVALAEGIDAAARARTAGVRAPEKRASCRERGPRGVDRLSRISTRPPSRWTRSAMTVPR
jgi:hypothetical protein